MAVTVAPSSIIARALRLIGALASGETPSGAEQSDALAVLNQMIDGWATQRLTIPSINRYQFAVSASVGSYTLGPTGVWTVPVRPERLDHASLVLKSSTPNIEIPLAVLTDDEYALLGIKGLTTTLPTQIYYNANVANSPNGLVALLWPVPTITTNDIALYIADALAQFADATTSITLAAMYAEALTYNLAERLAPEFGNQLDPAVKDLASRSLASLKANNVKPVELSMDPAFVGQTRAGCYNVLTDQGR
jgi:hypothetical protein